MDFWTINSMGNILGSGYFSLRLEVGIFLDASTGRLFKVIKDMLNHIYIPGGKSIWPIQPMHDFSEKSLKISIWICCLFPQNGSHLMIPAHNLTHVPSQFFQVLKAIG